MEVNTCSWYDPSCSLAWFSNELQAFFLWIWDGILSGMVSLLESFPVPDFLLNVGTYTLPDSTVWAINAFRLDLGLTIIVAAYTARFILRRIPVIG